MTKLENPVLMATIGAAQGLRGEVRARAYTSDPASLGDYGHLHSLDGRTFEVLEIRDLGDRLLSECHLRGRGKASGAETETTFAFLVDFRNGKIVRVLSFLDPKDALEAAGLSE